MFKNITVGSLKPHQNTKNSEVVKSPSPHFNPTFIRFLQKGKIFEVPHVPGGNLLKTTLNNGLTLDYKCGKGSCGLCKIKVLCGSNSLQPAKGKERKLLSEEVGQGFRLACQSTMKPSP